MLSNRELEARVEVLYEKYATILDIEARTLLSMLRTKILPAALRAQGEIAETVTGEDAIDDEVRHLLTTIGPLSCLTSFGGELDGRETSRPFSFTNEVVTIKKISMMNTMSNIGVMLISASSSRWRLRFMVFGRAAKNEWRAYSTVTDFARLRGWSTSVPRSTATW